MMREPFEETPSVSDFVRYRLGYFLIVVGVVFAVGISLALLESLNGDLLGSHGTLRNASQPDVIPAQAATRKEPAVVGTTGFTPPSAVVHEMATLTETTDYHQLIGRKVSLTVPVVGRANDQAFWVGQGDNEMLVELRRDVRSQDQRYFGIPASHHVGDLTAGQQVRLTGTIEPVPYREEMYTWGLTENDVRQLEARPIYIAADSAQPVQAQ